MDLPDEALAVVLGFLPAEDRRRVAGTSQQFARVVCSTQTTLTLDLDKELRRSGAPSTGLGCDSLLRSLLPALGRRRTDRLVLSEVSAAAGVSATTAWCTAAVVLAGMPQLRHLSFINKSGIIDPAEWLPACVPHLRSLRMGHVFELPASLGHLTALEVLELSGLGSVGIPKLPPSFTQLRQLRQLELHAYVAGRRTATGIPFCGNEELLGCLPALESLSCTNINFKGLGWLQGLGRLTTLELTGCAMLHVKATDDGAVGVEGGLAPLEAQVLTAQEVEEAVTPLRQLRHLTLGVDFGLHLLRGLQEAVAGMPCLEGVTLTMAGCIRMQLPGGATRHERDDSDDDGAPGGPAGFMGRGPGPLPGGMFMDPASDFMDAMSCGIFIS